tara:strand:+ start:5377 stop:5985 length:609 start_codon:yes stop_codon:yes gene_type:complete
MVKDQNQFENEDENEDENKDKNIKDSAENIHPEAYEEDINFDSQTPDNFFDLLEKQQNLSPHYKKMVKIVAKTNILKNKNDLLIKNQLKRNNILGKIENSIFDQESKQTFKIEINAKKNLSKEELEDTMKILNLMSDSETTQDTDLEIVLALLKKLLNYINFNLSQIENSEIENPTDVYKKLWNNKLTLEDTISSLELLDFS